VLGWSLSDFQASAPADVLRALHWRQYFEEQREKAEWERTRWLGYLLLQPYDSKRKLKQPSDIVKFGWEVEERKPETDDEREERLRLFRKMDALHNKLNNPDG